MCYPLDRDLSRGYHYPPFKQLESEGNPLRKVLGNWSSALGVQVASMTYNVGYSEGSKLGGGHRPASRANFDKFHISHALYFMSHEYSHHPPFNQTGYKPKP